MTKIQETHYGLFTEDQAESVHEARLRRRKAKADKAVVRLKQQAHAENVRQAFASGAKVLQLHPSPETPGAPLRESQEQKIFDFLLKLPEGTRWHLFVGQEDRGPRVFTGADLPDVHPHFLSIEKAAPYWSSRLLQDFAEDLQIADSAQMDEETLRGAILDVFRELWRIRRENLATGGQAPAGLSSEIQSRWLRQRQARAAKSART